jgi:acyl dehydratase
MVTFSDVDHLAGSRGMRLGPGAVISVDAEAVAAFAKLTHDDQWLHTDAARAATGPFGGLIAHGYFTLALIPALIRDAFDVGGVSAVVNYGLDRVRYPAPVRLPARLWAEVLIDGVERAPAGVFVRLEVTVRNEGETRPVCVANTVSLLRQA